MTIQSLLLLVGITLTKKNRVFVAELLRRRNCG